MPSRAASLGRRFPLRLREPLAGWTTLRIGGPAEAFFEPAEPDDLARLLDALDEAGLPRRMLGGGADTLAPDGGVAGAVVHTGRLRRIFAGEQRLRAWAGATLPSLVTAAAERGWSGLELLAGVPGQVGGALALNAGSRDWGIWDAVETVRLRLPDGRVVLRGRGELAPGYRDGRLDGAVVLEAVFALEAAGRETVRKRLSEQLRRKNATQPVRHSSAGCAFKNPPGDSAGRLLEAAGLKGARKGGAAISELHANFIVNTGGATAAGVRSLLARAEATVRDCFGVALERELVVWPEPDGARE